LVSCYSEFLASQSGDLDAATTLGVFALQIDWFIGTSRLHKT
jgi:hypothetical protein